ncbi:DNA-3-methyladenine glycosylase family protein [Oceanobacillus jeddahense]|uniref:DNA-3-methyladenine glycosylase family protein n=1 Tax=Oceanobacillus jeddahense TaxID=1462527 RepID=UPI000595F9F0|nr:DNA-3-methyladenine glycosylase [Oceanobacillus jeddahense]
MNYKVKGYLYPCPPFDFFKSIAFLQSFKPTKGEQTYKGQRITKAVELSTISVVFSVYSMGSIENPKLHYELYSDQPINNSSRLEAEDRISFFLSLDDNLKDFYKFSKNDKIFLPIVKELYGYHQVKFLTPFENACWAVLSTRNPMGYAINLKKQLMQSYGDKICLTDNNYYTFPSPNKFIGIEENDLNNIIKNPRKSNYLWNVIQAFNKFNEKELRSKSYQEVYKKLIGIKGIGEWSASFILLRGLGKMEKLPLNEKVLNKTLQNLYSNNKSEVNIKTISNQYGRFVGYWAHYIRAAANIDHSINR